MAETVNRISYYINQGYQVPFILSARIPKELREHVSETQVSIHFVLTRSAAFEIFIR